MRLVTASMAFKRVRFQEPEQEIENSTSFLKLKKRRINQRTVLPGHEQGMLHVWPVSTGTHCRKIT